VTDVTAAATPVPPSSRSCALSVPLLPENPVPERKVDERRRGDEERAYDRAHQVGKPHPRPRVDHGGNLAVGVVEHADLLADGVTLGPGAGAYLGKERHLAPSSAAEPDLGVVILGRPAAVRAGAFRAHLDADDLAFGRPQQSAGREAADELAHAMGKQADPAQQEGHHHQADDVSHIACRSADGRPGRRRRLGPETRRRPGQVKERNEIPNASSYCNRSIQAISRLASAAIRQADGLPNPMPENAAPHISSPLIIPSGFPPAGVIRCYLPLSEDDPRDPRG
jgi:hypothetical protein